jgi:hypothetical protein
MSKDVTAFLTDGIAKIDAVLSFAEQVHHCEDPQVKIAFPKGSQVTFQELRVAKTRFEHALIMLKPDDAVAVEAPKPAATVAKPVEVAVKRSGQV